MLSFAGKKKKIIIIMIVITVMLLTLLVCVYMFYILITNSTHCNYRYKPGPMRYGKAEMV